MCLFLSVLDFWFLCNTTVAWSSNYLEQKSQQFFQKTDYLAPQLLFPQKPSSSFSRTHRSEAYPLCKNAITNPFNRDTEGPPKNVLFTTLRLNRKRAAFPHDSAENGFPMSGGMQSGACVPLAVNIYCHLSHRDQWSGISEGVSLPSIRSHRLSAARARKVLKTTLNVVVA